MYKNRKIQYRISFFEATNLKDCRDYDGETPFHPVHVGDEIIGMTFRGGGASGKFGDSMDVVARVTKVVHHVQETEDTIHDIVMALTEPV